MQKQRAPLEFDKPQIQRLNLTFGEIALNYWLLAIRDAKHRNADLENIITTTMVPTGTSPDPLRQQARHPSSIVQARKITHGVGFYGMDDYCQKTPEGLKILPVNDSRSYAAEHTRELFDPLGVPHQLRYLFDPASDPSDEIERLESSIAGRSGGRIDVLLAGVGQFDAHVAFHLPGVPLDRGAHIGRTTDDIKAQNEMHCGKLGVPESFVTHGAQTFSDAAEAIILADKRKKKILLECFEAQTQTAQRPITSLLFNQEQKVTIIADKPLGTALQQHKRLIPLNVRVLAAA